jgi:Ca-activated chloride channel family protein
MAPGDAGAAVAYDMEGRARRVSNVRNVGNKTFYQQRGQWVDADVDLAEDAAKPVDVVQYSEQYFELVKQLPAEQNQYLTFTEPVLLEINGQVYNILPPKAEAPGDES